MAPLPMTRSPRLLRRRWQKGADPAVWTTSSALPLPEAKRLVTTGGHYAYLKIAEGCDKHCTYCIIPKLRGNYRSVPMERLVEEAEESGRTRSEGADPGGPGDHRVRPGSVRGESPCPGFCGSCARSRGSGGSGILYCYPEEIDRRADPR